MANPIWSEEVCLVQPVNAAPDPKRLWSSRALHRLNTMTTRPLIAIAVGAAVIVSWSVIAATGFDQDLQVAFATVCAGITVTMVFILQHTQRREQTALHLKLNEIVRALPQADDRLIGVEVSSDDEIVEIERSHHDHHAALRDDAPLYVAGVSDEPVMVDPAQRALTRVDQFAADEPSEARRKWFRR